MWRGLLLWNPTMVPCRVIYLFGQGKGAQARGWTDEGGTVRGAPRFLRGARAPPSDAPAPQGPWQHIGIDLVNNMPANDFGYLHILFVVCYLSKFVVARPLKTKTSAEVVSELRGIYLTFGVPSSIQHDQGKEFTSKVC